VPYLDPEFLNAVTLSMGLIREDNPLYIPPDEALRLPTGVTVTLGTRPSNRRDVQVLSLSALGAVGKYLTRPDTLRWSQKMTRQDVEAILADLMGALSEFIELVGENAYQLKGTAFTWHAGPGTNAYLDSLRVVRPAGSDPPRVNAFFLNLYRQTADHFQHLHGAEHTAQIRPEEREKREEAFRKGTLPALFCSPTMERVHLRISG